MKKEEKVVKDVTREDEQALLDVMENSYDIVEVRGRKLKVRWLHPAVTDWISSLIERDGDENKVMAKCAALIRLNSFWRCHLLYPFVWRWYYYIRQYTTIELTPLFEVAQKKTAKVEAQAYLNAMGLLIALKTTKKQMTKKEVEHILQELRMANDGKSPKSTE